MFVSNLELKLIDRLCVEVFNQCQANVSLIVREDIDEALQNVKDTNSIEEGGKGDFCIAVESLRYCFSVILSEVRQKKRNVMSGLFEDRPELAKEKSVLKEKLDAVPEYAQLHMQEELLFQLIEHLQNVGNSVTYLFKEVLADA